MMKKQNKENKIQYILDEEELKELLKNSVSWEVAEYCKAVGDIQSSGRYDEFFEEDRKRTGNLNYGIDEYVKEWIEEWIEEMEKNKKRIFYEIVLRLIKTVKSIEFNCWQIHNIML